jgi:thiol:disulfide interchange protein
MPPSPIGVTASLRSNAGQPLVRFVFRVPPDHVIYAERLRFETGAGASLIPSEMPVPLVALDKATGRERKMYDRSFAAEFSLGPPFLTNLIVKLQSCSNSSCYFPEKRAFTVRDGGIFAAINPISPPVEVLSDPVAPSADWKAEFGQFKVVGRATGFIAPNDFVAFLKKAQLGQLEADNDPLARYKKLGLAATLFLILVGGAALNLTPCVLPLIPINLAIIGAGACARSRRHGFWHGAVYGAGIALAYGVLGLVVVLTGSTFGTLNSSVWFNAAIALVFVALALAMFDLVYLDFSRFKSSVGDTTFIRKAHGSKSRSLIAFTLGGLAALLAGACVAPVVISVLLLSTHLYGQGAVLGLLLPFVLGLGMALPWPFAGASLTFLPKPGPWMKWVKYSFGALILLFAFYYGQLAYKLSRMQRLAAAPASASTGGTAAITGANQSLGQALEQARLRGRPVLIDFQASWCKNCLAMEEMVFTRTNVQKHLSEFVVVKYQAERPNESPAREVLARLGVMGLPTYVVLAPTPAK